jgi:hypothetical protein
MQSINLISLAIFTATALMGAIGHWYKKKRRGEIQGKLIDYMIAESPRNTGMMVMAVLVSSITAASTGALDGLDIGAVMAYLKVGDLPMPALHVLMSAFTLGWMADSGLNKGAA